MYLQKVIEQVTGQSLADVAQEMVFIPLGMSSSSFVKQAELDPRTSNGHWRAFIPALLFVIPYVVSLVLVGGLGLLIQRIRTGRWRSTWRMVIGACAVAYILSLLPAFILFENANMLEFAWLIALCGLALILAFAVLFLAGRAIIGRLSRERPRRQTVLTVAWSVLIVVVLGYLTSSVPNLPAPRWTAVRANAAGSVRATAGDMAAFLIEFSDPQYLSAETAAQLRTSQIKLSSGLSWGLGSGIQHSQQGDALWQWGQHLDFQSVMIIYPEQGWGVIVCTNSDFLSPNVAVEIAHRALGGKIEPIRRAVNLEFNYRGP